MKIFYLIIFFNEIGDIQTLATHSSGKNSNLEKKKNSKVFVPSLKAGSKALLLYFKFIKNFNSEFTLNI